MTALFLCIFLKIATFHPVHVSYTHVDIHPETKEIMLTHKFYTDDLRLLFYHVFGRELKLGPEDEISPADRTLLMQYFADAFTIQENDGDSILFRYIRKEQNEESVWFYFSGRFGENACSRIVIHNTLLLDLYRDQTNLVILSRGKPEKGYRFDFRIRELTVDLTE